VRALAAHTHNALRPLTHRLQDYGRHRSISIDLLVHHLKQDELVSIRHETLIVIVVEDDLHRVVHLSQRIVERLLRLLGRLCHGSPIFCSGATSMALVTGE
jgi:hypothetical protein